MAWFREDRAFYVFVFAYALVAAAIAFGIGEPSKFAPFLYLQGWLSLIVGLLALYFCCLSVVSLRQPEPTKFILGRLRSRMNRQTVAGLLLVTLLALFHGVFTSMKTMLTDITPFAFDRALADIDAAIHGRDPWLWLRFMDPATALIMKAYSQGWSILLVLGNLLVCLWPRLRTVRDQYIWTFLLCWPLLGNLVAGLVMSAGPIYYSDVVGDGRFKALETHVYQLAGAGLEPYHPRALWNAYIADRAGLGTGISAFPSLHLAMATLFMLLARRIHPWLCRAAIAYLVLILMGSVHLGWHYAVDGYFSIVATILIWKAVGLVLAMRTAPRAALSGAATQAVS